MGFFGKLTGKKNEKEATIEVSWIPLNSVSQIEAIGKESHNRPQLIFKHSTTCGISRMVLNMFNSSYRLQEDSVDLYYLDIHSNRPISNEIEAFFGIRHESPQLLIIREGACSFNTSHGAITDIDLKGLVQ